MNPTELPVFIQQFFADFLSAPQNNNLGPEWPEKAWQDFLIGYSSAQDSLYEFWKQHIGPFHWTPAEAFALGVDPAPANDLTVISWALSQTDATKADNRLETKFPSERWARSRIFGQSHNRALHRALVTALTSQGFSAVAPALLPDHGEKLSDVHGRSSNWSERHVAYTSGLGTFSLCGGLITPLGQAVRFGSVIVHASLPPTPRPYSGPFDYCLHFNGNECTACADRCPVGSMDAKTRNKLVCAEHLEMVTAQFVQSEFGFKGYGCGLCQTGVPCESGIPAP